MNTVSPSRLLLRLLLLVSAASLLLLLDFLLITSNNVYIASAQPMNRPPPDNDNNNDNNNKKEKEVSYTHTREVKPPHLLGDHMAVPDIVHQTYDYQKPSLFLFLSLASVRVYHNPKTFYFWVNDEGRYRSGHWNGWLGKNSLKAVSPKSADFEFISYLIRHAYQIYEVSRHNSSDHEIFHELFHDIYSLGLKSSFKQQFSSGSHGLEDIATMLENIDLNKVADLLDNEQLWASALVQWIEEGLVIPKLLTFPSSPPGNESIYVSNNAHRSDFVRMNALKQYGGIYLDTDVFVTDSLDELRRFSFSMGYDNIVETTKPRRLNNGIILSEPNAEFLNLWMGTYYNFDPNSWDMHSSIIPYKLAIDHPDLINVEMNRISPISFGFHTASLAAILTCGIYNKQNKSIHYPLYDLQSKSYTFKDTHPSRKVFAALDNKLALHLTMTQARGYSFMRKNLYSMKHVVKMHSLLGHYFRISLFGFDSYDYSHHHVSDDERLSLWEGCRKEFGMHYIPEADANSGRQQYI